MKVDDTPCPHCKAPPGALNIVFQLVAKPVGEFSVAGAQAKLVAQERPVLYCSMSGCSFKLVGTVDTDGAHVTFGGSG